MVDGYLPRPAKRLSGHGGPGVENDGEYQKGEGKKKVGLVFEGETVEGTPEESLGE